MERAADLTGVLVRCHRRGFGFIRADLVDQDVFFPAWSFDRGQDLVFDDLQPGITVSFDLAFDEAGRPQAQHVRVLHASALDVDRKRLSGLTLRLK